MSDSLLPQGQFVIQIGNLPEGFQEEVRRTVASYGVALVLETHPDRAHPEREVCKLVGSGTLVSWQNKYGILTADHVPRFPKDRDFKLDTSWGSTQRLRLSFDDRPNVFGFEARTLQVHTLGEPVEKGFGPDIAVILLPEVPELATLRARRTFWNLTNQTEQKLASALDQMGCMAIGGHPDEDVEDVGPLGGFREATFSPGIVGFTGQIGCFERDGFDYLEVDSKRTDKTRAPASYKGVSGGSLWRVPILRKAKVDNSKVQPGKLTLAGVPFYEFPEEDGRIRIRAHGPKTIYGKLLARLRT